MVSKDQWIQENEQIIEYFHSGIISYNEALCRLIKQGLTKEEASEQLIED